MNARALSLSLCALLLTAMNAGCTAGSSSTHPPSSAESRTLNALLSDYENPDAPGASAIVIHEGRVVFEHASGLADLPSRTPATPETQYRLPPRPPRTPATPETQYRLASLSKQFTAMAILLLIEEGRLHDDDRVVDVLPGFPPTLGEVRIRHLLQHTSGIWDYEAFVPDTQTEQVKDRDVLGLLARAQGTYFPPGTAVRYSNSGYAVLSLVVEQVSGMPFARFLHERVFAPLGMSAPVANEEGHSTVARRSYGYVAGADGFRPRDQSPTSAVLGGGGIYSSVAELVAWDRALDAHTLVGADTQRLAWTAPTLPDGTRSPYGFGWFVDEDARRPPPSHHRHTSA